MLENGAQVNIANSYNQSAFDLANESSMFIQKQLSSRQGGAALQKLGISQEEAAKLYESLDQVKMLISKIPNGYRQ